MFEPIAVSVVISLKADSGRVAALWTQQHYLIIDYVINVRCIDNNSRRSSIAVTAYCDIIKVWHAWCNNDTLPVTWSFRGWRCSDDAVTLGCHTPLCHDDVTRSLGALPQTFIERAVSIRWHQACGGARRTVLACADPTPGGRTAGWTCWGTEIMMNTEFKQKHTSSTGRLP